ncbi:hypothetical protein NC652_035632 [Populus alba x Populus x berolinensis]|nr:hypothetical protein NC652_035632 [Populus alba x Populus x berolinensis]
MKSHRALGIPVLLKPSTVINIPQKKIRSRIYLLKAWLSILEIKNHKSKSSSKCSP